MPRSKPEGRGLALWGGGLAAAAGAGWLFVQWGQVWAWLDHQFPVRRIEVAGEPGPVGARELGRWVARRVDGGLLTVDLESLRRQAERRPWIREARLRRRWPDSLRIGVRAHRAEARWRPEPGSDWRLLSERGAVFRPGDTEDYRHLPALVGPERRIEGLLGRWRTLRQRLGPDPAPTRLAVDARGGWTAELDGGIRVRFGRDRWQRRLERLVRVQEGWRLLDRRVERIDLRHPDGLAVAVREDPEQGADGSERAETGGAPRTARR